MRYVESIVRYDAGLSWEINPNGARLLTATALGFTASLVADSPEAIDNLIAALTEQAAVMRHTAARKVQAAATEAKPHLCDICDERFPRDEMYSVGGDRVVEGYCAEAFPSECNSCHDKAMEAQR